MPDSPDRSVEDDVYRSALNENDLAVYDRIDPTSALVREIKVLRLILYRLIRCPEDRSKEIVLTMNTLCRVIFTHMRSVENLPDVDGITSAADEARQRLIEEGT